MSLLAMTLLVVGLTGTTTAQLLLKAATMRAARLGEDRYWSGLVADPLLWLAVTIYGMGLIVYMAFLSTVPLWQGVMSASLCLFTVMLGGCLLYGERLTPPRLAAMALVAVGVFLTGWGGQ